VNLLELPAIFVVSCFASVITWELDREVFRGLFAVAAGVVFAVAPSE
jgi:hypothetical protein